MKKIFLMAFVALFLSVTANSASAAVTGDPLPKGEQPLLITNAGQGPGGKMGRLLISRAGAVSEVPYDAEPQPEKSWKTATKRFSWSWVLLQRVWALPASLSIRKSNALTV